MNTLGCVNILSKGKLKAYTPVAPLGLSRLWGNTLLYTCPPRWGLDVRCKIGVTNPSYKRKETPNAKNFTHPILQSHSVLRKHRVSHLF